MYLKVRIQSSFDLGTYNKGVYNVLVINGAEKQSIKIILDK